MHPAHRGKSLPLRERGLKFLLEPFLCHLRLVAPFAGAWIEIFPMNWTGWTGRKSLPLRERGLKYKIVYVKIKSRKSLPLRERGLKSVSLMRIFEEGKSLPLRERGLKSG